MKITLFLIGLFVISQLIGIGTVTKYIQVEKDVNGTITISHPATVIGEAPEVENKDYTFVMIFIAIIIGTLLVFVLIRFRAGFVWKYWYLITVFLTLAVALGVYMPGLLAVLAAIILAGLKVYRNNVYIHNLTEPFIYTGLTLIFIPILNLFSASILLIIIAIYDAYAVWKSKHMVKLAKFQTEAKVFAGLFIPYDKKSRILSSKKATGKKLVKKKGKSAILGGGDIAFPLLFSGTVIEWLILSQGMPKLYAFLLSCIIIVTTTLALSWLLFSSKEGKFYPAMPFISTGCFLGYGIIGLILFFI
ncbi:presenilin family intramembrane aspartyl protease [Nanoarchaeota archaeon]